MLIEGRSDSSIYAALALFAPAVIFWGTLFLYMAIYSSGGRPAPWVESIVETLFLGSYWAALPATWLGLILLVWGRLTWRGALGALLLAGITHHYAMRFLEAANSV